MIIMDYIVYDIFNNLIYMLLLNLFCSCFFNYRNNRKPVHRVIALIAWAAAQVAWGIPREQPIYLKILVDIIIAMIFVLVVYNVGIVKGLVVQLLYIGIYISVELIVFISDKLILNIDSANEVKYTPYYIYSGIVCQLIVFFIIVIIRHNTHKKNISILGIRDLLPFVVLPVLTLNIAVIITLGFGADLSEKQQAIINWISVIMILFNLAQFYTLTSITDKEMSLRENEVFIAKAKGLEELYSYISIEKEAQKARAHDYVNHLKAIQELGHKGDMAAQEAYIAEQINESSCSQDIFKTGHSIVDAVINRKYTEIQQKGISFAIETENMSDLKLNNSDLVTILSNILDNAIEATEKCDDKKITLKTKIAGDVLFIDSTNTMLPVDNKGKRLKTTKTDKINHGYGLANIKKAVDNNGGQCIINIEGRLFHISVVIPCS